MRAAVVTGPRRTVVEEVAIPEPGPGEVRVRIEGCGVCASNVVPWEGPEWMRFPTEPGGLGHESWGRVDALGPGVEGLALGDRVVTLSQHAYAEYDIAEAASVVRLPAALDGRPFPGEPLGCAMNILARAGIEPGQTVAIVGIGFLGALLTRLATDAGARVIAIARRPFALGMAPGDGGGGDGRHGRPLADHRGGEGAYGRTLCERVIEATGKQWPLDLAAELTAERGRLVIAGYHQDGPRQVNMQLWNWRGLDVINAHERDPAVYVDGVRRAVDGGGRGAARPRAAPDPQLSARGTRRGAGGDARPAGGVHEGGGRAERDRSRFRCPAIPRNVNPTPRVEPFATSAEDDMDTPIPDTPKRRFPLAAGLLFGLGLGGFFDGIVLHQLLQWHHMVSSSHPVTDLQSLEFNTFWDGLFHASTYIFVVAGLILLWRAAHRRHLAWSNKMLVGTLLPASACSTPSKASSTTSCSASTTSTSSAPARSGSTGIWASSSGGRDAGGRLARHPGRAPGDGGTRGGGAEAGLTGAGRRARASSR